MRWPRGPTLSFLGGPAEVQLFGPLRAFLAGELSAASWRPICYMVCSVASRLHDASWGSIGPLRAAAVRIGRAALEERQAFAFRPKKKLGCLKIGEF